MAKAGIMEDVKLDALPYVDQGYDEPGIREAVSAKLAISFSFNLNMVGNETSRRRNEEVQADEELLRVSTSA